MSETDDTDDLLLIPPDLYINELELAETYASGEYMYFLDTILSHVGELEDRVTTIEHNDSLHASSGNFSQTESAMDARKYRSTDDILRNQDLQSSSNFSTPQKPRKPRFKLNSLPSTPISNDSPRKEQMMKEIDSFIRDGKGRSKLNFDNAQNGHGDAVHFNGKVIDLKELESMLDKMEMKQRETEQRLMDKEEVDSEVISRKTWRCGDNIGSVPNYGYGMRSNLYPAITRLTAAKFTDSDATANTTESVMADRSGSASSSESTQTTARRMELAHDDKLNGGNFESMRGSRLMSLKDLWGQKAEENFKSLQGKLEEEKLRRQHCEQTIHELQTRVLELQERVAVAIDVDQAKDAAVIKYHNAWEQLHNQMDSLLSERSVLENDLKQMQMQSQLSTEESAKKIIHYENEASKALTLAHSTQEKMMQFEQLNMQLTNEISGLGGRIEEFEAKYAGEVKKNSQLNEIIVQKEIELQQGKSVLSESRKEVFQSKEAVELCQQEFTKMKDQYRQLEVLLDEKQAHIQELESKIINLTSDNDALKVLLKNAEINMAKNKEALEKNKVELRNFYQSQVEMVVKDKLKEFQHQLDKAEGSLQDEIKSREVAIAKTAAAHIQQLVDKHSLEVNLLEEKNKEEVRLYQVQLSQSNQKMENLHSKLSQLQLRRSNVAQQLHKVMEAQWREAMKIIDNSRSPFSSQDNFLDQLNTIKSRSYTNVEEVLSVKMDDSDEKSMPSTSSLGKEEPYRLPETPVNRSSCYYKDRAQVENELQKYMQMLLSKQPTSSEVFQGNEHGVWPTEACDDSKSKTQNRKHSKPPWK